MRRLPSTQSPPEPPSKLSRFTIRVPTSITLNDVSASSSQNSGENAAQCRTHGSVGEGTSKPLNSQREVNQNNKLRNTQNPNYVEVVTLCQVQVSNRESRHMQKHFIKHYRCLTCQLVLPDTKSMEEHCRKHKAKKPKNSTNKLSKATSKINQKNPQPLIENDGVKVYEGIKKIPHVQDRAYKVTIFKKNGTAKQNDVNANKLLNGKFTSLAADVQDPNSKKIYCQVKKMVNSNNGGNEHQKSKCTESDLNKITSFLAENLTHIFPGNKLQSTATKSVEATNQSAVNSNKSDVDEITNSEIANHKFAPVNSSESPYDLNLENNSKVVYLKNAKLLDGVVHDLTQEDIQEIDQLKPKLQLRVISQKTSNKVNTNLKLGNEVIHDLTREDIKVIHKLKSKLQVHTKPHNLNQTTKNTHFINLKKSETLTIKKSNNLRIVSKNSNSGSLTNVTEIQNNIYQQNNTNIVYLDADSLKNAVGIPQNLGQDDTNVVYLDADFLNNAVGIPQNLGQDDTNVIYLDPDSLKNAVGIPQNLDQDDTNVIYLDAESLKNAVGIPQNLGRADTNVIYLDAESLKNAVGIPQSLGQDDTNVIYLDPDSLKNIVGNSQTQGQGDANIVYLNADSLNNAVGIPQSLGQDDTNVIYLDPDSLKNIVGNSQTQGQGDANIVYLNADSLNNAVGIPQSLGQDDTNVIYLDPDSLKNIVGNSQTLGQGDANIVYLDADSLKNAVGIPQNMGQDDTNVIYLDPESLKNAVGIPQNLGKENTNVVYLDADSLNNAVGIPQSLGQDDSNVIYLDPDSLKNIVGNSQTLDQSDANIVYLDADSLKNAVENSNNVVTKDGKKDKTNFDSTKNPKKIRKLHKQDNPNLAIELEEETGVKEGSRYGLKNIYVRKRCGPLQRSVTSHHDDTKRPKLYDFKTVSKVKRDDNLDFGIIEEMEEIYIPDESEEKEITGDPIEKPNDSDEIEYGPIEALEDFLESDEFDDDRTVSIIDPTERIDSPDVIEITKSEQDVIEIESDTDDEYSSETRDLTRRAIHNRIINKNRPLKTVSVYPGTNRVNPQSVSDNLADTRTEGYIEKETINESKSANKSIVQQNTTRGGYQTSDLYKSNQPKRYTLFNNRIEAIDLNRDGGTVKNQVLASAKDKANLPPSDMDLERCLIANIITKQESNMNLDDIINQQVNKNAITKGLDDGVIKKGALDLNKDDKLKELAKCLVNTINKEVNKSSVDIKDEPSDTDDANNEDIGEIDETNCEKSRNIKRETVTSLEYLCTYLRDLKILKNIELTKAEVEEERNMMRKESAYVDAKFKCSSCIIGFKMKAQLRTHMQKMHRKREGMSRCPVCRVSVFMSWMPSWDRHMGRHYRRVECTICNQRFQDVETATQHYRGKHEVNEIKIPPPQVDIPKNTSNNEETHIDREVLDRSITCPICRKYVMPPLTVAEHMWAGHNKLESAHCQVCDRYYKTPLSLKLHKRTHRKSKKTQKLPLYKESHNDLKVPDEPEVCPICLISVVPNTFATHLWEVHRKLQSAHCLECNMYYSSQLGLKLHLKTHRKKKKRKCVTKKCKYCDRRYKTGGRLQTHVKTCKQRLEQQIDKNIADNGDRGTKDMPKELPSKCQDTAISKIEFLEGHSLKMNEDFTKGDPPKEDSLDHTAQPSKPEQSNLPQDDKENTQTDKTDSPVSNKLSSLAQMIYQHCKV